MRPAEAHYVMLSFQVLDSNKQCLAYVNFSTRACYYVIKYTRGGLFQLGNSYERKLIYSF